MYSFFQCLVLRHETIKHRRANIFPTGTHLCKLDVYEILYARREHVVMLS